MDILEHFAANFGRRCISHSGVCPSCYSIYTWAGSVLIAVNPYQWLPIYDSQKTFYRRGIQHDRPHIYSVADHLRNLVITGQSVTAFLSGDSGSGKTETSHFLTKYLTWASAESAVFNKALLAGNLLLEYFGNARTIHNQNSSRFGKLCVISYSGDKIIKFAFTTCLLATSRCANVPVRESNFHVIEALCRDVVLRQKYRVATAISDQPYISAEEIISACHDCGITDTEIDQIWSILAAILALNAENISLAAEMLRLDPAMLTKCFAEVTVQEEIRALSSEASTKMRKGAVKHLYQSLFDWITARVNNSCFGPEILGPNPTCNILDIFGFEDQGFLNNGFEQLCINYTNERLHELCLRSLVVEEVRTYRQEGIHIDAVSGANFFDHLTALSRKSHESCLSRVKILHTIFDEIHDASHGPIKETDRDSVLASRLNAAACKRSRVVQNPLRFRVVHYASSLDYNAAGFSERNRDQLNHPNISKMVSEIPHTCLIKPDPNLPRKLNRAAMSTGLSFVSLVNEILKSLDQSDSVIFVRCIRSNSTQAPLTFDNDLVQTQLLLGGIPEILEVASLGYKFKLRITTLAQQFRMPGLECVRDRDLVACLVHHFKLSATCLGPQYLFLKESIQPLLSSCPAAEILQIYKEHIRPRRFVRLGHMLLFITRVKAMVRTRKELQAVSVLLRNSRIWLARRKLQKAKRTIIKFQAIVRGIITRNRLRHMSFNEICSTATTTPATPGNTHEFDRDYLLEEAPVPRNRRPRRRPRNRKDSIRELYPLQIYMASQPTNSNYIDNKSMTCCENFPRFLNMGKKSQPTAPVEDADQEEISKLFDLDDESDADEDESSYIIPLIERALDTDEYVVDNYEEMADDENHLAAPSPFVFPEYCNVDATWLEKFLVKLNSVAFTKGDEFIIKFEKAFSAVHMIWCLFTQIPADQLNQAKAALEIILKTMVRITSMDADDDMRFTPAAIFNDESCDFRDESVRETFTEFIRNSSLNVKFGIYKVAAEKVRITGLASILIQVIAALETKLGPKVFHAMYGEALYWYHKAAAAERVLLLSTTRKSALEQPLPDFWDAKVDSTQNTEATKSISRVNDDCKSALQSKSAALAARRPKSGSGRPKSDSGRPKSDSGRPKSDSGRPKSDSGRPKA